MYESQVNDNLRKLGITLDKPVSSQLERIEQGMDKLMQSHAALDKKLDDNLNSLRTSVYGQLSEICHSMNKKLDCLQGRELLIQFQAKGKPKGRKR